MKDFIKKYLLLNIDIAKLHSIQEDLLEENRKCIIVYSTIVISGMSILLFLSLFVDVLVSSRNSYIFAIITGSILLFIALKVATKYKSLIVVCQYILTFALLGFGIILGTIVEPNQASASFAVLMFVTPLLFTDLPYRINTVTILSMIVYIFAAKATQSADMFGFNMSIIMPYGLSNLVLTHFTSKMKLERFLYAYEKKLMGEYDRLTGLLNRWSFEKDVETLRHENTKTIAVCSFDVNCLKNTNDTFGHKAGDDLLVASTNAIKNVFEKYGVCYRVGGDEFMAILEGIFPSESELIKMLDKETANYINKDYGFELSISSGVVVGDNTNIDKLIYKADQQMYKHKTEYYTTEGRDRRQN